MILNISLFDIVQIKITLVPDRLNIEEGHLDEILLFEIHNHYIHVLYIYKSCKLFVIIYK